LAHSAPFTQVDIVRDYQTLLKPAVLATQPGGVVLATNHVSAVDKDEWLDLCSRCCAKAGRPLTADPAVLEPHNDFPAFDDGKHPLKIALLRV
jgi:23S rRNA (cytosine1962-C5)-methyltransferase